MKRLARASVLGCALALAVACAVTPRHARAEDDGPVVEGRVTEEAARARRLFEAERWGEAAIALHPVMSGQMGDGEAARQLAQYHLAIALHRLGFHQQSLATFSLLAEQPGHLRHREALPWLARIAAVLPEPAGIGERIGRYSPREIARYDNPAQRGLFQEISYLRGRHAYEAHRYEDAIAAFALVGPRSPRHAQSELLSGIAYVQLRRAAPAIRVFLRAIAAIDAGAGDAADRPYLRDLANLSIARVYYSTALQGREAGGASIDAQQLGAAITHWDRVGGSGEGFTDALFEQAWAYFMAGDLSRALGNLHALDAPYFPGAFYPEAEVLRGVVSLSLCRYDDAATIAARMRRRYEPARSALEALIARFGGDLDAQQPYRLLADVHAGRARLPAAARPIVERALSDRQIARHVAYVRELDAEIDRLRGAPAAFRASAAGAEVADGLELARELAAQNAGALARSRCERALRELTDHLDDARKLMIDAMRARRSHAALGRRGGRARLTVEPDEEHEIWPFDGEYWRDEIGSYRQEVVSECGR